MLKPPAAATAATNILVVDDDPGMRRVVQDCLEGNNMAVATAAGRGDMERQLAAGRFSMVLLDLQLGRDEGLDLLRDLRVQSDLPVIIMTGHRRDEIDRVVGLELGADDYILKPFSLRELLARIRVVLRRTEDVGRATRDRRPGGRLRFGAWALDWHTRQLTDGEGRAVALTKGEYALLNAFLNGPQRPMSREHLLQATRVHEDVFDRSIDVQILRLRRKLETDPSTPEVIRTKRASATCSPSPCMRIEVLYHNRDQEGPRRHPAGMRRRDRTPGAGQPQLSDRASSSAS